MLSGGFSDMRETSSCDRVFNMDSLQYPTYDGMSTGEICHLGTIRGDFNVNTRISTVLLEEDAQTRVRRRLDQLHPL